MIEIRYEVRQPSDVTDRAIANRSVQSHHVPREGDHVTVDGIGFYVKKVLWRADDPDRVVVRLK